MALLNTRDGYQSTIDDEDEYFLSQFSWYVRIDPKNGLPYVFTVFVMNGHNRRWFLHRAVFRIPPGHKQEVDHIETVATLDNRKQNLRLATRSQNNANRRVFKNNTSGFKGVYCRRQFVVCGY